MNCLIVATLTDVLDARTSMPKCDLKVFTCRSFKGHNPVGTAAVIIAANIDDAIKLLEFKLNEQGLHQDINPDQLTELCLGFGQAIILHNGDY